MEKHNTWFKRNLIFFVGFLVPFIVLGIIFMRNKVFPFGDNIYLRSDMYHQYAPFYKELYRKLTTGGSMDFSWDIGMGVNFSAVYSYYLASPVNLLLGLVPEKSILLVMDFLILFKTGLAGFAATFYLAKHFKIHNLSTAAFGLFYALSSYMAAFSWNIMWLDCMVLLPFILLGLEALVQEKKYKMYTISLGLAIFSNYYIAIMICIFVVLYFAVLLVVHMKEEKNFLLGRILKFGIFSLLAGGIGAVMILPEIYALRYTASGEFSFPETWINYFSILDMLRRSLIEVPVAIFEAHDPNVYCSILIFFLLPLYCVCANVNKKEKIGKIGLIVLLLISFNTNIPNYIWHGFHFPNSLPARESFIYIFLAVTMMYEAYLNLRSFSNKQIWGCFAGGVGVILLIEELYQDEVTFENIYISLLLLLFYFILFAMDYHKILYKPISIYLLVLICATEMFLNSCEEAAYKPTTYSAYLEDNDAIEAMVDKVNSEDKDFFRIEKLERRTKNDAAWNGYKGVSVFSSMASAGFTEYLGALGFEKSTNAYSYYGFTPFTSSLLSVKYVLSDNLLDNSWQYTLSDYKEDMDMYLYRVNYCLPLGFMVNEELEDLSLDGNNPFSVQNQWAGLATGEEDMFTYIPASTSNKTVTINVEEESHVYVYVTTYVDSISYSAYEENSGFSASDSFSGLNHRQVLDFGTMPAGTVVTVNTSDTDATSLQLYAYDFHEDVFERVYEKLKESALEDITYDDTHVNGKVTAKNDGLLYTSIIYDKGWKVTVDGKKTEYTKIGNALIAVPLTAGEHEISFSYEPQGKKAGMAISILSVLVLAGIVIVEKKKKPVKPQEEEKTGDDILEKELEKEIEKEISEETE